MDCRSNVPLSYPQAIREIRFGLGIAVTTVLLLAIAGPSFAQIPPYDASWYDPASDYVEILVVEDGVHSVDLGDIAGLGVNLAGIDPSTFRLLENGQEIPILYSGSGSVAEPGDSFMFVGRMNTGEDELWVYNYVEANRSSDGRSLYSDTTHYFLTWGGAPGVRYTDTDPGAVVTDTVRTLPLQVHLEDANRYHFGASADSGNPLYTIGEGYIMRRLIGTSNFVFEIPMPGFAFSSDSMTVLAGLIGGSGSRHVTKLEVEADPDMDTNLEFARLDSIDWSNYLITQMSGKIEQDDLQQGGSTARVKVLNDNFFGASVNYVHIDYIDLEYVGKPTAVSGQTRFLADQSGNHVYELGGFGAVSKIVLAPTTARSFTLGAAAEHFGDTSGADDEYFVSELDSVLAPVGLSLDVASDLANTSNQADYIILHAPSLEASAQSLKDYRESADGGSLQAMLVNVDDVFDQFDYGRPTPIAIQRFVDQARSWSTAPQYLVLWGDALYPDPRRGRREWEVPSFGNASSDGWFGMQSAGVVDDWTESVAIGRMTIRNDAGGEQFIQKLQSYESQPLSHWQKDITLMAGGATLGEQAALQASTLAWGDVVTGNPFGGDVTYYFKSETTVLDPTFIDSVDATINQGTGWLAFFGHSAADTWEIVTATPTDFQNATTLPVALSLGCFTGAFARGTGDPSDLPVYAELLVTESLNGGIGHWGGSTSSFISPATAITNPVYDIVFVEGERIVGKAIREGKRRYVTASNPPGALTIETNLQYNFIGDPFTRITLPTTPDFHLENRFISFDPIAPVANVDSVVNVSVVVENYGLVQTDSATVKLTHWSPDQNVTEYELRIAPFALLDTVQFVVPLSDALLGDNRFQVYVDPLNEHVEENELNNTLERNLVVFATGLSMVYPPEFGLVTTTEPSLRVGITSQDARVTTIEVQVDTTSSFDSPTLQSQTIDAGLIEEWTPMPLTDGESYYWRARVDDPTQPEEWKETTFSIRTDYPGDGWYQQEELFRKDDIGRFIALNELNQWEYRSFGVKVELTSTNAFAQLQNQIAVASGIYVRNKNGFGTVVVGTNGEVAAADNFLCHDNVFAVDQAVELADMQTMIDTATVGSWILMNTRLHVRGVRSAPLPPATEAFLTSLGSVYASQIDNDDIWTFAFRKGYPGSEIEDFLDHDPQVPPHELVSSFELDFFFDVGEVTSTLIGPATDWKSALWEVSMTEPGSYVTVEVQSPAGDSLSGATLNFPATLATVDLAAAGIDAVTYPYLQLKAELVDESRLSTPQLVSWYVEYDPVAELVLDPASFLVSADSVQEGESISIASSLINTSSVAVDTVFVEFQLTDASNDARILKRDTLIALPPESETGLTVDVNTLGLVGTNRVQISARQTSVGEEIVFNNTVFGNFFVRGDQVAPEYSITIEGVEYPSDDRVITNTRDESVPFLPATPTIEIVVSDENQYLPLADTTFVTLLLDGQRVPYNRPEMRFDAGTTENNEVRLLWTPDFTGEDTTHTLELFAEDASGNSNPSKDDPYRFNFRVQTQAEIQSLYPYPNPMNNYTNFAFRLRGADPSSVEDLRIRVFTVSGRLVREFDLIEDPAQVDGGGLHIGWNKVFWDGTDEDGDQLARGVYLYKVYFRADGQDLDVNNDTGIEKLAIIR